MTRRPFGFVVGLASTTHYLPWLRRLVRAIGRAGAGGRLSRQAEWRCTVALIEALNNAIIHGHRRDARRRVWLACRRQGQRVTLAVSDRGPRFSWRITGVPPPTHTGGRGLYLMRSVMDRVTYRRVRGWNTITLTYDDGEEKHI